MTYVGAVRAALAAAGNAERAAQQQAYMGGCWSPTSTVRAFASPHADRLSGLLRREALKHLSHTGTSSTAPTA